MGELGRIETGLLGQNDGLARHLIERFGIDRRR
jgi:hypothetical protein